MKQAEDSKAEWDKERGAIEQEVARDLSNPSYKLFTRINQDMFAGTPYEHGALGTAPRLDRLPHPRYIISTQPGMHPTMPSWCLPAM